MKRIFLLFTILLSLLFVSCGNLFDSLITDNGSIVVNLPGAKSSRAGEDEFEDNTFYLALYAGETLVKDITGATGSTAVFNDLEPGTYRLYGYALSEGKSYEGTEDGIEVVAHKTTAVNLTLKLMDFSNPRVLAFNYEADRPEYNRYLGTVHDSWFTEPLKANSVAKITISGVPSENVNCEINYYYGQVNTTTHEYEDLIVHASDANKVNWEKGVRFTDVVYFFVTDTVSEGWVPHMGAWYSRDDCDKPVRVTDFDLKIEYVSEYVPSNISVKSSGKGLEVTVRKPDGVSSWNTMQFSSVKDELYLECINPEGKDEITFIWPFALTGELGLYKVEGNFDDVWQSYIIACKFIGSETGIRINSAVVKKYLQGTVSVDADYNIKMDTPASLDELKNVVTLSGLVPRVSTTIYGGKVWETWIDRSIGNEADLTSMLSGSLNLGTMEMFHRDILDLMETLSVFPGYSIDVVLGFEHENYPNQLFSLPNVYVENLTAVIPEVADIRLEEVGTGIFAAFRKIQALNKGDYVLLNIKGTLSYDDSVTTDSTLYVRIEDCDTANIVAPNTMIASSIANGETYECDYGFYITENTDLSRVILFVNNDYGTGVPPTAAAINDHSISVTSVTPSSASGATIIMPGENCRTSQSVYFKVDPSISIDPNDSSDELTVVFTCNSAAPEDMTFVPKLKNSDYDINLYEVSASKFYDTSDNEITNITVNSGTATNVTTKLKPNATGAMVGVSNPPVGAPYFIEVRFDEADSQSTPDRNPVLSNFKVTVSR